MSDEIFSGHKLVVTRYCGPSRADNGVRTRYQFTFGERGADFASLSYEEATRLKAALALSLAQVGAKHAN